MKKLDKLLITSFVGPFIVTFFIALFVFVMQTLWLYIDEIAGKGVGFFLLTELVGYLSVSMIPMSLPVAVLISSVMVLGNLAERYELSSIKSAGVSLWRTMMPLMLFTGGVAVLSFFCSNYFIPVSNLKFKSRLYDIRQQKPALSLEESLFNTDFQGFSIRIGDKLPDNSTIRNVLVYDNGEASQGRLSMVAADSGQMFGSKDNKYFVMQLFQGQQIAEPKPITKAGRRNYPMMRSTFKSWTKVFDLDQFELDRTDENLFKSHHTMLSNRQLLVAIDSIDREIVERGGRMAESNNRHFYFLNKLQMERTKEKQAREAEEKRAKMDSIIKANPDSAAQQKALKELGSTAKDYEYLARLNTKELTKGNDATAEKLAPKPSQTAPTSQDSAALARLKGQEPPAKPPQTVPRQKPNITPRNLPATKQDTTGKKQVQQKKIEVVGYKQVLEKPIEQYSSMLETFEPQKRSELLEKARNPMSVIQDQAETTLRSLQKTRESKVKHVFEFHSKFSLAMACVIFLFVGAPMGAIVRKGGFGWPLLISIVFFMLFIVISIFSKNIAERFVINAVTAAWMNCLVVFPMGLALTYWAMRDMGWGQIVEALSWKRWLKRK
ncbi:MAG: LptF/LptG family permease [Saprospiraceae bacterium]|nr:LptF/LptG family permease [Saprospiraceae bacterium]